MIKRILIFVCLAGMLNHSLAQEMGNKFSPFQIPASQQDDIWSVDFAPVFWLNDAKAPLANNFSFSLGLNYHYELNFSAAKRFSFALGLGYAYTSLNHSGVFSNDTLNQTIWTRTPGNQDLKYSRFNLHRINIPLEFRVKTTGKFKIYFGYQTSFIIASKNKSKIDGQESSFSNFSSLTKFQHGPRLRIGYKDVFVFSNFYLSSMFKRSSPIKMQLVEVGISIGG